MTTRQVQINSHENKNLIYFPQKQLEAQFALTHILAESEVSGETNQKILQTIGEGFDWELGELWRVDFGSQLLRLSDIWHVPTLDVTEFEEISRNTTFAPGVGLPGRVWATGRSVVWIEDITIDSNFPRASVASKAGLHSAVAFPLTERGNIIGVMAFLSKSIKPLEEKTYNIIADVGVRIGSFLNQKKAEELFLSSERRYKTLLEVTSDFVCMFNTDEHIFYLNKGGRKLIGLDINEKVKDLLISDCYPKWIHDRVLKEAIPNAINKNILSGESVLIHRNGSEIPVLQTIIAHRDNQKKVEFLSLMARDITKRINMEKELKQNFENLQKMLYGTIEAISLMCEMRDPYTAGHEKRVAKLACAIAKKIGLGENRIEGIHVSAYLHDIGKIASPAEILCKPSELNGHEYGIVKAHPEIGYRVLKNIKFPWPVASIVLQHHEVLNGTGYPAGIKGNDILLETRIITVADVVEAMAAHRPYRAALGIKEALRNISRGKGTLYDPKVVDVCIKLFRDEFFSFSV